MDFTFNTTAGASQSTVKTRLAGNGIYEVKFVGCEIKDVQGVKEPDKVYKQVILNFENEEGAFDYTVWEPRPEDFNRTENEYTDKKTGKLEKIPQPSNVENMMLSFKHAIDALVPEVAKKIDTKEVNLAAANWDDLRRLVVQILDKGKGVTTKIKLLKNKKGEAVIPGYFAALSKEGKAYVKNNFIGNKIGFTTYELQRINNEAAAKPTDTTTFNNFTPDNNVSTNTEGLNMDFNI